MNTQRKRDLIQVGVSAQARLLIQSFGADRALQIANDFRDGALDEITQQYWVKVHDKIMNLDVAGEEDDK